MKRNLFLFLSFICLLHPCWAQSPPRKSILVPSSVAEKVIPLLDAQLKAVKGDRKSEQEVSERIVALEQSHDPASDEALVVLLCFYVGESQEETDGVIARGKKMYPLLKKYRYRAPEIPGRSYQQLLHPANIKRNNFDSAVEGIRRDLRGTWDDPIGLPIRPDGLADVKIGMDLTELNKAIDARIPATVAREAGCPFYASPKYPKVFFMMEDDRLSRIDVEGKDFPTAEGIQVGDSEAHARKVYGKRLEVEPAQYDDEGKYLTVLTPDRKYGIRFTTHKGKIVEIYGGRAESIQYVEDCL